jgi:biopolymer transport protein ExbD
MRKRFKGKKLLKSDMALQITSMADIFTILLVFLLKSFSTGITSITPSSSMTLPEAKKSNPIIDTLKLEISSYSIVIDDKPVMPLQNFQFELGELESNGTPQKLNRMLAEYVKKDTLQKAPKMLLLADQKTPFSTLKRVLVSATSNGFVDYKLVVVEDQ